MDEKVYNLYFVKNDGTPLQNAAFEAVSGYENLYPVWIDGSEAIKRFSDTAPKNSCFIFSRFCGPHYEHFKALGSSIYGPQVILDYLREQKPLPNVSYPLYSTALRDAHITVTSVAGQERERLFSSIELLHGEASRHLTDDVNVVITPKVGSKKYVVGASRGLHIIHPDWIDEAWKLSEISDPINMMQHDIVAKYKLPTFAQLVICVSGLSLEERKEVSRIVSKNGGRYSGEMQVGETTHLVVKCAGGVKYNFAKKWKIRIVTLRWLTDSVTQGYALDENDYSVDEGTGSRTNGKASTPTSSAFLNDPSVLGEISAITDVSCMKVDETRVGCFKDLTNKSLRPTDTDKSRPFLSNCVILLYGCSSSEISNLSKIVSSNGGILCSKASDKVTESLTHVILGCDSKTTPSNVEPGVFYVTSDWLINCCKENSRLPEHQYRAAFLLNMPMELEQDETMHVVSENRVDADELQLINQYFGDGGLAEADDFASVQSRINAKGKAESACNQTEAHLSKSELPQANQQKLQISFDDDQTTLDQGVFGGLVFSLHVEFPKYQNNAFLDTIANEGGVITNDESLSSDFIIFPFVTRFPVSVSTAVTEYWITSCVSEKRLLLAELENEIGYKPIYIPDFAQLPLEGCVMSLSGYTGAERTFLTNFSKALGATVQECFLRKAVPSRGLVASTHLIAARPDGRKFPASCQWGLPAVSCRWLYACAKAGHRVPEAEFTVTTDQTISNADLTSLAPMTMMGNETTIGIPQQQPPVFKETLKTPQNKSTDFSHTLSDLKTPAWVGAGNNFQTPSVMGSIVKRIDVSPPLSEQVTRCLKTALAETSLLPRRNLSASDFNAHGNHPQAVLSGVVVCVAKSLGERQIEINNIVKQLGGDFRWNYDPQVCTHMVAESWGPSLLAASPMPATARSGVMEPPADIKLARDQGKHLVSLEWVLACQRFARRVSEVDFPVTGTPNSSCNDVSQRNRVQSAPEQPQATATSLLLGDVTRRLESVMGKPLLSSVKSSLHPNPDKRDFAGDDDTASTMAVAAVAGSGDPNTPCGPVTRRSRRTTRRALNPSEYLVGASHVGVASSAATMGDELPLSGSNSNSNINDLAHPAQALQVRWQYEDAPEVCPGLSSPQLPNNENSSDSTVLHSLKRKVSDETISALPTADINKPKVFSLSGLNQEDRERYAGIIHQLGGELDNSLAVSDYTTHLIVHAPSRSEKYLMSLASGKWILHKSYLDACAAARRWLPEAAYEWGGPGTEPLLVQLSPAVTSRQPPGSAGAPLSHSQLRDLAKAARYWRQVGGRAFADWNVIFGPGCDRETSFRRVIEIGCGKVLANSPPYPPPEQVTHAFFKKRSTRSASSTTNTLALPVGYEWLRFDLLCAHLTGAGQVSRGDFALEGASTAVAAPPAAKRARV